VVRFGILFDRWSIICAYFYPAALAFSSFYWSFAGVGLSYRFGGR
jgi:hypothetical protein